MIPSVKMLRNLKLVTIQPVINLNQLSSTTNLSNLLRVGQTLNISIDKVNDNQAIISLGKEKILADVTADAKLKPGPAQVTVKQVEPSLILSIKQDAQPKTMTQGQMIQSALKVLLPNQSPVQQTTQQFQQILQGQNLPPQIQSQLQTLLDEMFKPLQKNGQQLKERIENSGLFFEAKLKASLAHFDAQTQSKLNKDFKHQLLQLKQAAQNIQISNPKEESALKELSKTIDQAISRTTYSQIQNLENRYLSGYEFLQADQKQQPIENTLEFRKSQQNTEEDVWEVIANLKSEADETVIKFRYTEPDQLKIWLWSSDEQAMTQWQQRSEEISQFLQNEIGIQNVRINTSHQKPIANDALKSVALIDIKV